MNVCWWVWNGVRWAEDPTRPHACQLGFACASPDGEDGTFIGQTKATSCVPAP